MAAIALVRPEPGEIRLGSCSWCGGSGYWNGWPCVQCNQPENDGEDEQ